MNSQEFAAKKKGFDRQIKEARRASQMAPTLDEKLICIREVKRLLKNKYEFIMDHAFDTLLDYSVV